MLKRAICIICALALFAFAGCAATGRDWANDPPKRGDAVAPSDYSKEENWLSLPETDMPVDVFYLYPTAWAREDETQSAVCAVDYEPMRERAADIFMAQASAFAPAGNVYAPYYRQLDAAFGLSKGPEALIEYEGGVPAADVVAAFDYYIQNYNKNKPFILAGHSQGSMLLKQELLYGYLKEHPDVCSRMVAAYVIGYSVTEQELAQNPHVKFAQGAADTGVVVSYNTEAPRVDGSNSTVLEGAISINPINWTRDETPAGAEQNMGSVFAQDGRLTLQDGVADAKLNLERGTLICSSVEREDYYSGNPLFPLGVYHAQDYAFYYMNLRQNAALRAKAYLAQRDGQTVG